MANENGDLGVSAASSGAGSRPLRETDAARVKPDALMAEIIRPRMGRMVVISTIFHVLLIGLTSVSYLTLCVKHRTLHPKWVVRQIQKEEAEKQETANVAKAAEEAKKRAAERGGAAKKGPGGKEGTEPGAESRSGGEAEKKAGDKKSGVEKAVTETSKDRPTGSSINLELE